MPLSGCGGWDIDPRLFDVAGNVGEMLGQIQDAMARMSGGHATGPGRPRAPASAGRRARGSGQALLAASGVAGGQAAHPAHRGARRPAGATCAPQSWRC